MSTAASAPPLSTSAALPKTTGKLLLPVFGLLGSAFGAGVGVAVGFTVVSRLEPPSGLQKVQPWVLP